MRNVALTKMSSTKHFLLVLGQIWDHFIIVMWQKYLLLSGLRFWFTLPEIPFLTYPKLSIICVFNAVSKKWTWPKTGLLSMKIKIWDHFTINTFATLLLWSGLRFALGLSESVFFRIFLESSISHWNTLCNLKMLPLPEIIGLERKQKLFLNRTTMENKLGTCTLGCPYLHTFRS